MKLENRNGIKKGADVATYLSKKDAQIKSMRSTTAGVAEGVLTFPNKKADWEISVQTWTGRDGNVRDYPCVICVVFAAAVCRGERDRCYRLYYRCFLHDLSS